MRRVTRTGQHNCEAQLFYRTSTSGGFAKHGAEFEEPDVAAPHSPVVLDAPDQAGEEPGPQMRLLRRQRVLQFHRVGAVRGTEGKRPRLEQAVATRHQLLAKPPHHDLTRVIMTPVPTV